MNRSILKLVGVHVETSTETEYVFEGIKLNLSPQVILKPSLGVTLQEIKDSIGKTNVTIALKSSVVFDGETFKDKPESLHIDG